MNDPRADSSGVGTTPSWDLLRQATRDLKRLRATRGRSRRTARQIRETSARLVLALALLGGAGPSASVWAADPNFCFLTFDAFGITDISFNIRPAFADIDGDGDLDAFIGGGLGSTYFFQNTGTATAPRFAAPVANPFGLADVGAYSSPTFADIDGDGDLDALIGEDQGRTIFFRNTGTAMAPAFAAPSTNPFGLSDVGFQSSPALADIDGDGDLDALIGEDVGRVIFFRNTGTAMAPAFAAPSTNPFGLSNVSDRSSPALADIDGDGDLDVLIGEGSGNTTFLLNTGTTVAPAFATPLTNAFGLSDFGSRSKPALADIDGDGDVDAFIGLSGGYTIFFQNSGTAMAPAFSAQTGNPFGLTDVGSTSSPALADIDADGDLDAFIGQGGGSTIFFLNTGTITAPAFSGPATNPFGLTSVSGDSGPTIADIDADDDLDLFSGEVFGNVMFFQNSGVAIAPAFSTPATNPFGFVDAGSFSRPVFADIDADGDFDAFVGESGGNTLFFLNTGTTMAAAFAAPVSNAFGLANVGNMSSPALDDIDGDGDLDALIGESSGNTIFFRNTGTTIAPAFAAPVTNPFGLADVGTESNPELADLDGDGDLDALVGNSAGQSIFFPNACAPTPTTTATSTDTPVNTPTPTSTPTAAVATCPMAPSTGCATAAKSQLQLRDNADDTKDQLKWQFSGGPALVQSDFGDPLTAASYALCVYDDGLLKLEALIGPSGTLWKASGSRGYLFSDTAGTNDGVNKVKLLGGTAGKSKLQIKGKGTNIPMPAPATPFVFFNSITAVTAQLHETNGDCYETAFTPAEVTKNDATQFKAKK